MIRTALIDDHAIVRVGLRQFLSERLDLIVAAEAASGQQAIEIARAGIVDVIVLDISMPECGGIEALNAISCLDPKLPILVLSGLPEEHYAREVLRLGARGFLNKECDPDELVKAIRKVAAGRKYISSRVAYLIAAGSTAKSGVAPHELLSKREYQVFLGLANGGTVGSVAESMALSMKTISTFRTRLLEKMSLTTNADLTYYGIQHELIG